MVCFTKRPPQGSEREMVTVGFIKSVQTAKVI